MTRRQGLSAGCALLLALALLATPGLEAHGPVPPSRTPGEYCRNVEQTFLTYPEWFLVHSPGEYAALIQDRPPSDFPFFGHIGQFWKGYWAVARATRERGEPANPGYHVMIVVIGLSTTVEYGLRGAYETLCGRVTEILRSGRPTPEDLLAARTAQDYVDFIRVRPWYEFDFLGRVRSLWTDTRLLGPDLLRKWERRLALTNEYLAKAAYGWAIGAATHAAYEQESTVTAVIVDHLPPGIETRLPELKVIEPLADGSVLATVPRYAAFTDHARVLAREGVSFREIAGNRSLILVSVLVPRESRLESPDYEVLFREPILTRPAIQRGVLVVPVERLSRILQALGEPPNQIEHVYDY